MAASTQSPSGFSYAQAAKGQAAAATSQTPSSKVTSGAATAATGTFSELAPNSNWADDVEANEGEKTVESRKTEADMKDLKELKEKEQGKAAPVRDIAIERTKSDSRAQNASSGVSSPDLAATSSTTNTDESGSVPNGTSSSDTTWETKSQNSEPAWIAERKERQTTGHHEDSSTATPANGAGTGSGKRGKKEPKEAKEPALAQPPQKPVNLQEAPPPAVNIWAKRMEESSKKTAAIPQAPKITTPAPQQTNAKENQRPTKTETRKKANSIAGAPREPEPQGADSKKPSGTQGKRVATDARTTARQGSKPVTDAVRADLSSAAPGRAAQRDAQSLPNLTTVAPPPVKDEVSWPTPDSALEKERKAATAEKEPEETDADAGVAGKSRDKTKWTPLPVTPTIVWATEEMIRPRGQGGERGGRGSTTARGRGGLRGTANGPKGGDRAAAKTDGEAATTGRGRSGTIDREAMPPPPKPSSTSASREASSSLADGHAGAVLNADSRSTKSPSKADFESQEFKPSESNHHPASHGSRTDDVRDGSEFPRDAPTKKSSFENKKTVDNYGAGGKEWNPRGKARGGRGRGGSREFANGHQPSPSYVNGHTDYPGAFGVPQSPSAFQSPRGSHAYGFAQPGRGGWSRGGNPRSQSIPEQQIYGRAFGSPSQGPPVQTYYPGMYEYPGAMSMAAVPFSPMLDPQYVVDMVSTQLEYYFSLDNLLKDMFLRKNMDTQGFVFLDVIANFNRLKQLTMDKDVIKFVCLKSESIEIRVGDDGKERLRRKEGWEQFVLPMDQREVGAQTDGAQSLHRPEPVQMPYWPGQAMAPFRGPPSGSQQGPRHDSSFAMNGGVMQFAPMSPLVDASYGDFVNGEEHRGRAAKSPVHDNGTHQSLTAVADMDPDVFADEHISSLTVVVKMNQPRASPHHNAASRTFSNGSNDTRSVYAGVEKEKPVEDQNRPVTNGEPLTNGDKSHAASSRHASPSFGRSPEKSDPASELMLLWVKDKEFPQESLPQNATLEPYVQLRVKALDQRGQAATGACPYDLDVLYQFWSHFLIRNFNKKMYGEFKYFAMDDALQRCSPVGLQNLVQFYAKALASSNPIRDHIVKDYVHLVRNEPQILNGQAHKQLRQAWRNGALNLKNRKKLADVLDDDYKQKLES